MKRTLALVTFAALLALFALESPAPAGRIIAELVLPDNPTGKHFTDNGTWVTMAAPTLCVPIVSGTVTLTNQAAADTELPATFYRVKVDLAGYTEFRVVAQAAVIGASGADLRLQGSTDNSAFGNLDGANGPEIDLTATGEKDSGWVSLAATYQAANIRLRLLGKQGNATADPVVRQLLVYFR